MSCLYLVRHGEAERLAASDADRPLTDRGLLQAQRAAARIAVNRCLLLHSPYRRAVETADVIARHIGPQRQELADWLIPSASAVAAERALADLEPEAERFGAVILVSHNPLVSQLLATLTGESEYAVSMPTGGLVRLEGSPWLSGCMTERWLSE